MNQKTVLILSALALGLFPLALRADADGAMSGMDMSGMKMSQKSPAALLSVTATINPATPKSGANALDLMVTDSAGKPVTGLKLTGSVAMTSMDMGTTHPSFTEAGSGHYKATVNFSMDGPWRVVVLSRGGQLAVLNFQPGSKTPWKSPQVKATGTGSAAPAPAANAPAAMAGMDMGGGKADAQSANNPDPMAGMAMDAPAGPDKAMKPGDTPETNAMPGMDMGGAGLGGMKTATVPELQEKGTYTATGNEDWKMQTGFGHNAGMVGMMNQMMVGGSGMEGMKMAPMTMKFDEKNYAKPDANDPADSMPGMDMGGDKKAGQGGGMTGMNRTAPTTGGDTPPTSTTANITAATTSTPKAGDNPLTISITDAQGKPIAGATITASVVMTSMDMGTSHPAVTEKGGGHYAATVNFSMAGPWRVEVKVTAPGRKPQTKAFDFSAK